ncbi:hypothetical protein [Roseivirga pacifica]|uniref:hypothetical protein n=1 Tax=Roseivirga pacifica TaxID=1267423 RepID=UPI002095AE62|nr:hypothetical protein [Roseivirga pacifica]MCO6360370.1 hypothetical protein [Roseivirga pacifica]MCO6368259.1 hypothetical protein [Roseivirga pacifica]MCO6372401.1 hypothetical protein [Roseivirga pacifica]MCO6376459.1 hypothetical protein [Roseivirga pacifica]MCO6378261.1 hypothetical protein [Roseivirga pacifica]
MKYRLLLCALFIFSSVSLSHAQIDMETIEIIQISKFKTAFNKCGINLYNDQLYELLKDHPTAGKPMKNAFLNSATADVFKAAGSILIFWPITQEFAENVNDPDWYLAGIGAGAYVLSFVFQQRYKNRAINAVNLYNDSITKTGSNPVALNFEFYGAGAGLRLTF